VDADDGIFYMSFEDVAVHFMCLNVCLVRVRSAADQNFESCKETTRQSTSASYSSSSSGNNNSNVGYNTDRWLISREHFEMSFPPLRQQALGAGSGLTHVPFFQLELLEPLTDKLFIAVHQRDKRCVVAPK
jgi:hypothetical protein